MPNIPNINQDAGEFYRVRLWKKQIPGLPLYPFAIEETLRLSGPMDIQNNHPYYLILFVTEGMITHHYGNLSRILVPGNVLVVPPGIFSFHADNGYHKFLIGLKGREIERLCTDFGLADFQMIPMKTEILLKIIRRLDHNLGQKNGWDLPEMLGDCFKLLVMLSLAKRVQIRGSQENLAEKIREKLERSVHLPLKLKDFEESLGIPLSSLRRIFRKRFGISPKHFLSDMRLQRALELLELSDLSMKEIAAETGFRNQYYFSNAIKKAYDCAPGQLRFRLRTNHKQLILPSKK